MPLRLPTKSPSPLITGHLTAFGCALIWGTTFVSTKFLLESFSPLEVLFFRNIIAYLVMAALYPRRLIVQSKKQELLFILAGISGITLYYLFENVALAYSTASNVGVIVAAAPFFSVLWTSWACQEEKPGVPFFLGFLIAMAGIFLISFNGFSVLKLNPLGDLLAFLAALIWGVYSLAVKKLNAGGYPIVPLTRRIFFYGLLFMIPPLFLMDFRPFPPEFKEPANLFNILFLGLVASAAAFILWNKAIQILGVRRSSVYIYLIPVVSIIFSVIFLKERITTLAVLGALLALLGLFISQRRR
jgi:drug/metabolite transporter (DMT)-like permease